MSGSRPALVFDFDGVLFDSARESFAVARLAYLTLRPASSVARANRTALFRGFVELMPLGNGGDDYGVMLTALDRGASVPDQAAYDRFRATLDPDWLAAYGRRFYDTRAELETSDRKAWLSTMPPYDPLPTMLREHAGRTTFAIATAKDRASVDVLLAANGLGDLFPAALIEDRSAGASKRTHLERLQARLALPFDRMTFVDDKVNHLDDTAPLGVRCVLAAWGYNGPREHTLALERGYDVLTLAEIRDRPAALFG